LAGAMLSVSAQIRTLRSRHASTSDASGRRDHDRPCRHRCT
jgi:hypothetical protein